MNQSTHSTTPADKPTSVQDTLNVPDLSTLRLLDRIALWDGLALLGLIFVGVPLKRWMDFPWLVKLLGPTHGVLFLTLIALVLLNLNKDLLTRKLGALMVALAFIPFGALWADKLLRAHIQTLESILPEKGVS